MELYVWASPIEGLVSIDYHCIAAVAYIQIAAKGQFSIVPCTTPGLSPTGQLPFLKDGSEWIGGLPSIIRFLLKHGHDADAALNASQKAISSAYASLVYDRLCDVISYVHYVDHQNYINAIRPAFSKILGFPFNYITPHQNHKTALVRLAEHGVSPHETKSGFVIQDEQSRIEALMADTLDVFEVKLGQQRYMVDDKASSVDALFLPFIQLMIKPQLKSTAMVDTLKAKYSSLVSYAERLENELDLLNIQKATPPPQTAASLAFFIGNEFVIQPAQSTWARLSGQQQSSKPVKKAPTARQPKSEEQLDFERKRVWAIAGGVVAMMAYIIFNGIVQVEIIEEEKEEKINFERKRVWAIAGGVVAMMAYIILYGIVRVDLIEEEKEQKVEE